MFDSWKAFNRVYIPLVIAMGIGQVILAFWWAGVPLPSFCQ
jgi:hypothetical protein